MAIDTENKRRSVQSMAGTILAPVPDGSISDYDRRHLLGLYSGYTSAGLLVFLDGAPTWFIGLRNRTWDCSSGGEMQTIRLTDYDIGPIIADFSKELTALGLTLDPASPPTVEFLELNLEAPTSPPTAANFVLDATSKKWEFDKIGGTLGDVLIGRVKATRSDGKPIEGNGKLEILPG